MSGNYNSAPTGSSTITADQALRDAFDAFRTNRLDDAERLARSVAEAAPQLEDAWRILAAVAQRQGRLADAAQTLREGIAQNPMSPVLFTDLGSLLRDIGRIDDAETALRHALSIRPDYSDAALNLGNMLVRADRLHEAEYVFRRASSAEPNDSRLPLQMGRLMLMLGNVAVARQSFEKAVALSREALSRNGDTPQDPTRYTEAASNLGSLLLATGERLLALNYFFDAVQLGGNEAARRQFAECVSEISFAETQPLLKPLLVRALSEAWIAPEALMRQGADQLMLDPEFSAAAERIVRTTQNEEAPHAKADMSKVARDPLLRALLTSAILPDPALERLLMAMRRRLLQARIAPQAAAAPGSDDLLAFAAALANQCHLTDYVYAVSAEEAEMTDRLAARIAEAAQSGQPIAASDIAAFAAYRPLSELGCADALLERSWERALEPVIRTQLREPLKDAELRETISRITPVSDETAAAVGKQDADGPHPRWVLSPVRTQRSTLGAWLGDRFPHLPAPAERYRDPAVPLAVLVAGCGTGREIAEAATRFLNSELQAIDPSRTSLAYAQRKTDESGLKNITYAQADILELGGLGRQFDFIECTDALHHLPDPAAAWRVLAGLSKPGGYMLMGCHSRLGRRGVELVRAFVAERGYGTSVEDLRRFRADVEALPSEHSVRIAMELREEFYSLGMLRNLLSGTQERQFTISEIAATLDELGLEFCGFMTDPDTLVGFRERFGAHADLCSAVDWETFENIYTDTFSTMYRFLVRKPD